MATVSRMCLLVLVLFSCGVVLADQVTDYSITKGDPKVRALEACGDNGTCFSADLSAPGEITSIDYSCSGGSLRMGPPLSGWRKLQPTRRRVRDIRFKCNVVRLD
jgi:hypothetical protein